MEHIVDFIFSIVVLANAIVWSKFLERLSFMKKPFVIKNSLDVACVVGLLVIGVIFGIIFTKPIATVLLFILLVIAMLINKYKK